MNAVFSKFQGIPTSVYLILKFATHHQTRTRRNLPNFCANRASAWETAWPITALPISTVKYQFAHRNCSVGISHFPFFSDTTVHPFRINKTTHLSQSLQPAKVLSFLTRANYAREVVLSPRNARGALIRSSRPSAFSRMSSTHSPK